MQILKAYTYTHTNTHNHTHAQELASWKGLPSELRENAYSTIEESFAAEKTRKMKLLARVDELESLLEGAKAEADRYVMYEYC